MSDSERILNEALHMLAGAAPNGAPERIEIALRVQFRRYRRFRNLRRGIAGVLGAGALAACIALMVLTGDVSGPPPLIAAAPGPPELAPLRPEVPQRTVTGFRTKRSPGHTAPQFATEFVPLPYGDDSLVDESAVVVRVDLPRSALRLAGFTVAQDRADDRVQADVVLGADGLAHAVRLVNQLE